MEGIKNDFFIGDLSARLYMGKDYLRPCFTDLKHVALKQADFLRTDLKGKDSTLHTSLFLDTSCVLKMLVKKNASRIKTDDKS